MISNQRVVVITGCSSGFGYLTALKFAREHCLVYAGVRSIESAGFLELKEIAVRENLDLRLIKIDVTDDNSVMAAVARVQQEAGRVDILVNNAGFGYLGPVETFTIEEVKAQFETNVFGLLRMVKAVVPLMRLGMVPNTEGGSGSPIRDDAGGRRDCHVAAAPRNDEDGMGFSPVSPKIYHAPLIINLSSINGLISFPLFAVYSASKHAVEALSEGLRFELLPFGIRVVLIEPGSFMTKFTDNRRSPLAMSEPNNPYRKLIDNFFRRYEQLGIKARTGLLYRFTRPEQVAELIFKIAGTAKPRLRYRVGLDAHLYYWLHRLLPEWIWERLLRRAYRW